MVLKSSVAKSAVVSEPDGIFRWSLSRSFDREGLVYLFLGVNPSTADHTIDDQTVKKWNGFVERFGGSKYLVGNVFSYRATDVKKLKYPNDLFGSSHYEYIDAMIAECDVIVPCWGSRSKVPKELHYHFDRMLRRCVSSGKPIKHFGLTASGDPKHPLMLSYSTELQDFEEIN